MSACELCEDSGGRVLWQGPTCRVVLPDAVPSGLCRVVLARHVPEMTDLDPTGRGELMRAVFATEAALRAVMVPDKVNLASLGNLVPHLHWHVIPRWRDDPWWPASVWAAPAREGAHRELPAGFAERMAAALRDGLA